MPTFTTPSPIDLAINLQVGAIQVIAGDRADTVVTVAPTGPDKEIDRRGVENTKVDFDGQRLTVTGPRPRLSWIGPGPTESVDIKVELPTGSRLTAEIAVGNLRTRGQLGATRVKSSTGSVDLDATGDLWVRASHGTASVDTADGAVEITADMGQIRIGTVTGDAVLKASHGNIMVDDSRGDLDAKLSYGDLELARSSGSVTAKTAYGNIQLREVSAGSIQLESGFGQLVVAVKPGVPAWLDLSSKNGHVRNELGSDGAPAANEQTVAVHARTQYGDIDIVHAR
jgi:DUF4097 and DUF4098 domain-containing protein YvlB